MAAPALAAGMLAGVTAQQGDARVAIDPDDIGGVVTSSKGPEAGVWVVAETKETPTKFARMVVTDDRGRYVLPDLPRATYDVFVRGYGLVDSPRVRATPGQALNLTAVVPGDPKAAAQFYPAAWWMGMMRIPDAPAEQEQFQIVLRGCYDCHEVGNPATRTIRPETLKAASSSLDAWERRVRLGPSGGGMAADFARLGEHRKLFAEWTDRIAKGEVPSQVPPRPRGVERNLVVTLWDWGTPLDGRADNVATDKRDPTVNANGPVYGVSQATDGLMILDPNENKASLLKVPSNAPPIKPNQTPSLVWGEPIWERTADPRSVEIDGKGRVWLTARTRENRQQPSFCNGPGANKFGQYYPLSSSGKQVGYYDTKTGTFDFIDTCFTVDHNEASHDNVRYYGSNDMIGWVDMDVWDKTHDAEKAQGWCPAVVDTSGDGKISRGWTEPDQPVDPAKDHRIRFGCYSIAVNEKDGSLWCSSNVGNQKKLTRIEKGPNPPETCRAEFFEPPAGKGPQPPLMGTGGLVADRKGVLWQGWRVSGHFTAFDRSKCRSTKDPQATGQSCPEGYTIYRNTVEPTYANSVYKSGESYLNHMDTHDVLGLGLDSPMYGSINTDSLEVFSSNSKQFVTLRVPYPMGFFARSATVRIDDAKAGWKGKGLWSSFATYASWHIEGGKGTLPKAVKFQMRPNPLAK
ncbi:MAG: carboxypeptidase-like regulatory domain-containing protein [Vicinamibacterales bacterium]